MKNYARIIFAVLLVLAACSKDDSIEPPGLTGTWIWHQSIGGFGGWTLTPTTEGYTQKIIMDDIYYSAYRNDSLLFTQKYATHQGSTPGLEDSTFLEVEGHFNVVYTIDGEKLILSEQCADCFQHTYQRQP
jgi:hypothetical protein